jgi:hypothetical protein
VAAVGLSALVAGTAGAGTPSALAIEAVSSGRTPAGHPWFVIQLRGGFPPGELASWYVAIALGRGETQYRSTLGSEGGPPVARLLDERGRRLGTPRHRALRGGGVLIVLPVRARPEDPFVVLTGQRLEADGATMRWVRGSPAGPLRLGTRTMDPLSVFATATPPPSPPPTPSPAASPPSEVRAPPSRDGATLPAILLGMGVGAGALAMAGRRSTRGRGLRAAVLAVGGSVGTVIGLAAGLGGMAGAGIGLLTAVALLGWATVRPAG